MSSPRMWGTIVLAMVALGRPAVAGSSFPVTTEQIDDSIPSPTFIGQAPGDCDRLFISSRAGLIHVVKDGMLLPEPFLDIAAQVEDGTAEGAFGSFAFHPDYATNGSFFVTYTDLAGDSVISRFQVTADPDVADVASESILITIAQPGPTHNVGWIGFGPSDGLLYLGAGDGGNNTNGIFAQDLASLLGKILRIDVDGAAPYGIPPGNPFVGRAGLDEIWSYGLRNPWRCSFDRVTGDLWIGDVGQASREEIDFQPAASTGGENYGWSCMEGDSCYAAGSGCTCDDPQLTDPVHDYSHATGCAVIGGYVYRGAAIPDLQGLYVFTDLCAGEIRALDPATGLVEPVISLVGGTLCFGEDNDGELYVGSFTGVRKLVLLDCNGNGVGDPTDIAVGFSDDCNLDGVPDECQIDCNGNGVPDDCDVAAGTSPDANGNGVPDECEQDADLDDDGMVGITDLLILLGGWGPCPMRPDPCPADIDLDGQVGITDLLELLGQWG